MKCWLKQVINIQMKMYLYVDHVPRFVSFDKLNRISKNQGNQNHRSFKSGNQTKRGLFPCIPSLISLFIP